MLQSMLLKYWSGVLCLCLLSSCKSSSGSGAQAVQTTGASVKNTTYVNPVFEPILADPTVVRNPQNKLFYAYVTADNWGNGSFPQKIYMLNQMQGYC